MSRLQTLKAEFESVTSAIKNIEDIAAADNRLPNEEETSNLDNLFARAADLQSQVEQEADRQESINKTTSLLDKFSTVNFKRADSAPVAVTAGEHILNTLKVMEGKLSESEYMARSAGFARATTLTDVAGLLPHSIVGPLIDIYDATSPCWNSFRSLPLPDKGESFSRNKVTQKPTTADYTTELDPLATRDFIVTKESVSKWVEGGTLAVSKQTIDWSEPAVLDQLFDQFLQVYTRRLEERAADALTGATFATSGWDISTVAKAIDTVVDAVFAVGSGEATANTIYLDRGSHRDLMKLTNDNDVSVFSLIQDALSAGGHPGLKVVVSREFGTSATPSAFRLVADANYFERYESQQGFMQSVAASNLQYDISLSSYGAIYLTEEAGVELV